MKIQQTVSAILLLQQGIEEAIKNYTGFAVLEKKVFELALGVSRMMLEWVLRDLDDVMLAEQDRNLEVVGFREKTLVSLCGEVVMKRRLYKDMGEPTDAQTHKGFPAVCLGRFGRDKDFRWSCESRDD